MIVFLTLCYCGVLAALIKLGVIKLNTFWKISPLIWVVVLLTVLIIPMQWGAPSGAARVFQTVVEVVPNVSGEVVDVPARPLVPMHKGDVIFEIDKRPFEYAVEAKRAALAESEQAVPQLKANLDAASAAVNEARAKRDQAQQEYQRYAKANDSETSPYSELDVENRRLSYVATEAALERALANERQAKLAYQSEIDGVNTTVTRLRADLLNAEYNLNQTVVRAPSDGFILGLTLTKGQRVSNLPLRSWVAFVNADTSKLIVGISQTRLRHVKPGQRAEVTLQMFPGQMLGATVEAVAEMTPQGQVQASGLVPTAPNAQQVAEPVGVILKLDEQLPSSIQTFGGAVGTAAIYTESASLTHVVRRIMMRMDAWLNYLRS